jgi:hypothetical protein
VFLRHFLEINFKLRDVHYARIIAGIGKIENTAIYHLFKQSRVFLVPLKYYSALARFFIFKVKMDEILGAVQDQMNIKQYVSFN